MSHPPTFQMQQKPAAQLHQMQRLMMTPKIQQSLALLQMSRMELEAALTAELEENPLLEMLPDEEIEGEDEGASDDIEEFNESQAAQEEQELDFTEQDFLVMRQLDEEFSDNFAQSDNFYSQRTTEEDELKNFKESSIAQNTTLFEFLIAQAHENFSTEEELAAAEILIGYIDADGFLGTPLEDISRWHGCDVGLLGRLVETIQTFEPQGVGAQDLREALLIQLRCQKKEDSLAYAIVDKHYDNLLNHRIPKIAQELHSSAAAIEETIEKDIATLNLHPGKVVYDIPAQTIVPDISIVEDQGELQLRIHDDHCFSLRLNGRYLRMLSNPDIEAETEVFIKKKIVSAKWLLHNLYQRNQTLEKIARYLMQAHYQFFTDSHGCLTPLTMQQLADELGMHESTIARGVANKFLSCGRGVFPLRFFFSTGYVSEKGEEISSQTVRDKLIELIAKEEKHKPLTDAELSTALRLQGIPCARRTVAKYRQELQIATAQRRRTWG